MVTTKTQRRQEKGRIQRGRQKATAILLLALLILSGCGPVTGRPSPGILPATEEPSPAPTPAPMPTLAPAPTLPPAPPLGLTRMWRAATDDTVWEIGALDLQGDGSSEVWAASYDHAFYLLRSTGEISRSYMTAAPLYAAASADLDGDGRPEFLCGGDDATVYALGSALEARWSYPTDGRVTHIAVGDVDRDRLNEVLAATWTGSLFVIDGAGQTEAQWALDARPTALAATDLDGDTRAEILVGLEDGAVQLWDNTGHLLWQQGLREAVRTLFSSDMDGDGRREVAVAGRHGVVALFDDDGTPRWARRVPGTIVSMAGFAPDNLILLGQTSSILALQAETGLPTWEQPTGSGVWTMAVLVQSSGPVIAAGTDDGTIFLLNRQGQVRGRTQLPSRVHGLAWANLDGQGPAELLARSADYIYAYRQAIQGEPGAGQPSVPTFPYWPDPSPLPPVTEGRVAVAVVGDIMLARSIEERMVAYGPLYPFRAMAPLLQQADIAVGNLETVLALGGEPAALPYTLRAHPSMARGLQEAGFDLLNLANNHAPDYGPAGLTETIATLEGLGMQTVGAGPDAAAPVVLEVRGLRVAFLARNSARDPGPAIAGVQDEATLRRDIGLARAQADVVILLLHTGQEYTPEPSAEQRRLARAAVEAGAALVVGYHRYRTLDTERYGEGFIAYGLGNFVSDIDIEDAARDGAVLWVVLNEKGLARVDWIRTRTVDDVQPRPAAAAGGHLASEPLLIRADEPLPPPAGPRTTYVLSATVYPETGEVAVRQRVLFPNTTGDALKSLDFFVLPNAFSRTFALQEVTLSQKGLRFVPSYTLAGTLLRLFLADDIAPGETVTVSLSYSLSLPPLDSAEEPPDGNLGRTSDGRIVQLGHWYPQLVPYRRGYGWQVWDYYPVGDPFFTDIADYRVMLVVPANYRVMASVPGQLEGQSRLLALETARDLAIVVARDYDVASTTVNGIVVQTAFRREHAAAGRAILGDVARAMALFEEWFGPYPYTTFTLVEGEMFGGMEYSGMAVVGSPFFQAYQDQVDTRERTVLVPLAVHELAHQWWYGVVGNDQVREPWLDEALARYSEALYYEAVYSSSLDWWWQSRVDGWGPTGYVDNTIYDYPDTLTYVHNLYGQGAHFIHDLRQRMGDEAFFRFLQRYYREFAWQWVTRRDFFRLVNEAGAAVDDLLPVYFQK